MGRFAVLSSTLILSLAVFMVPASAGTSTPTFPWDTGFGTVTWAMAAKEGSEVFLSGVSVLPGSVDKDKGHFWVHEPWEGVQAARQSGRVLRIESAVEVAEFQTLDVEGQIWTVDGEKVIWPARIYAWTDYFGKIIPGTMPDIFPWPWKVLCEKSALPWGWGRQIAVRRGLMNNPG